MIPDTVDGLRDYFAAAALQGLLAIEEDIEPPIAARCAYNYADAMLIARARKTKAAADEGNVT